nr:activating signal cointegrator 1 [Ipomoea trifida]
MASSGAWLEKELLELCKRIDTGLDLDSEIISGLVSYCELASPLDAKEYLDNIIGQESGKGVIEEYMKRRGHSNLYQNTRDASTSQLHAYVKPPSNDSFAAGAKKPVKVRKDDKVHVKQESQTKAETSDSQNKQKQSQNNSKKKKSGKVLSLAEAAKGSIVFQQGKPCSCQARRHKLISNCLSCGKIVCEQEGEGPCNFCGSLVLKEGSSYAGLDGALPISDAEAAAEAFAKRLVDYDRNAAARTTVIDDQSDYYEIEGNSWLSMEEKELLRKKREEIEEIERAKRSKVVVTFDLVGRKVLLNQDEVSGELHNGILLRPSEEEEKEKDNARFKPSPNLKIQPIFLDPGPRRTPKEDTNKVLKNGLCLEITGRVQHDANDLARGKQEKSSNAKSWHEPSVNKRPPHIADDNECSLDYN